MANISIAEKIGLTYPTATLNMPAPGRYRDTNTGEVFSTQHTAALGPDQASDPWWPLYLLAFPLQAQQRRELVYEGGDEDTTPAFTVETLSDRMVIRRGLRAVAVPLSGLYNPPWPGPVMGLQIDGKNWYAQSQVHLASLITGVETEIVSNGPNFVQWRVTYRWGNHHWFVHHARWLTDSDTIVVEESIAYDSEAYVRMQPFKDKHARALVGGGGEGTGPSHPFAMRTASAAVNAQAGLNSVPRIVGHLGHLSYFNQWTLAWVGFAATSEESFVGIFTGASQHWQRHGNVRLHLIEDAQGHALMLPLKQGKRCYGLVFTTCEQAKVYRKERSLLNVRKTEYFDLPLSKVRHWKLDPPALENKPTLHEPAALQTFRQRLANDANITQVLQAFAHREDQTQPASVSAAVWSGDAQRIQQAATHLDMLHDYVFKHLCDGGYERLIIFQGRVAKRIAYDLDLLRASLPATSAWLDTLWSRVTPALLACAYVFADPDYARYEDALPIHDPQARDTRNALRDDMGDCPVPPNFFAEFFTTFAVVAELVPDHPQAAHWRQLSVKLLHQFLEQWFAPDGTYTESVNYHTHIFNEILCQVYAQWHRGVHDWRQHPRIRGSFEHFVQIMTPVIQNQLPRLDDPASQTLPWHACPISADWTSIARAVMPNDGNSGGNALQQCVRGDLTVGAWLYRDLDPQLSAQLMHSWQLAARPLLDHDHPTITLTTLDPSLPAHAAPWVSTHRQSLGLVHKAKRPDGHLIYATFRAGRATHHMDFDQGNLTLSAGDTVLLGDHGYHTHDNDGSNLPACITWLHNTVTYHPNRNLTSGYFGLELAPEPLAVHLSDTLDWCVLQIANTNFRDLSRLSYVDRLPVPITVHHRQVLFVKPDYFVVYDTFLTAHHPATQWWHPPHEVQQVSPNTFITHPQAKPGNWQLQIQFVLPTTPKVIENQWRGPLWSLAVEQITGEPFMTLLWPRVDLTQQSCESNYDPMTRTLTVTGPTFKDCIVWPEPNSTQPPHVQRQL